ncbi:MAG: alpha/beta hydrolase [Gemmatimonadota bacterium]|nr:alpha/beta hydrolase [Gemmatimonadota bacterium]
MSKLQISLLTLALAAAPLAAQEPPHTYVLVHGAWGGGWAFRTIDSMLTAAGHRVYRPTLTGLGERVHLGTPEVGLSTHVIDIVNVLLFENLRDVVLVGHSYGGMVITGVADRVPERIRHLVYIDALVPEDGESLVTASRGTKLEGFARRSVDSAQGGFIVPTWVNRRSPRPTDVRQPVRTFTEPVSFRNPAARRLAATYILTVEPGRVEADDDFAAFGQRAKSRGWAYRVLRANHLPERSAPKQLTMLLRQVP